MSKFTQVASTMQTVSLAAMEEASREGLRTADIEHMLLALTIDGGDAGRILRGLGVELDAARSAIADFHAEQLAGLGIAVQASAPAEIVFHKTGGYEWTDRAIALFRAAEHEKASSYTPSLLRALLAEPSGTIAAILTRLSTAPAAVAQQLDALEQYPSLAEVPRLGSHLERTVEAFVAAPLPDVWALLADPARMPEWDPQIGEVLDVPESVHVGASWSARTVTAAPDGKPLRVKESLKRLHVAATDLQDMQSIAWRVTFPDAPRRNAKCVAVRLEAAAGGTQLHVRFAWEPAYTPRIRVFSWLLRPAIRFAVWMQANGIAASIGRVFR